MALAYFLTWTTYGSWLPGDKRGWVNRHRTHGEVIDGPCAPLERYAHKLMPESTAMLDAGQRAIVEGALRQCLTANSWRGHAISVRSNHAHAVVTACDIPPGKVLGIMKSHATKALNAHFPPRKHWWAQDGSKRILHTEEALRNAVRYVFAQDDSWTKNL